MKKPKRYSIPLIEKEVLLYVGEEQWEQFKRDSIDAGVIHESSKEPCPIEGSGRNAGSWTWVYDWDNRAVILHELSHAVTAVMDAIGSDDTEFRAHVVEWLFESVLRDRDKQLEAK